VAMRAFIRSRRAREARRCVISAPPTQPTPRSEHGLTDSLRGPRSRHVRTAHLPFPKHRPRCLTIPHEHSAITKLTVMLGRLRDHRHPSGSRDHDHSEAPSRMLLTKPRRRPGEHPIHHPAQQPRDRAGAGFPAPPPMLMTHLGENRPVTSRDDVRSMKTPETGPGENGTRTSYGP
jgi:hypothetical protein